MPLDPQIKPLVDAMNAAAAAGPPPSEQTVEMRREGYAALAAIAGAGPQLDTVEDREIAGVPCRVYANGGAHGIFMFIHGGGYVIGDLDTHDQVCRQLALETSATVISVGYRLAPEHPFPVGLEDCWAVLQALDSDRDHYGTGSKIVVGGDSAGGNLSAVLALMARDAQLDLAAQLLVYPGVDNSDTNSPSMIENGEGYVLTREAMDWFMVQYKPDLTDWRGSPILAASHAGVAPAVVITAEFDPLRDQGAAYADKLAAAGVDVTYANYPGMVHVFFQLANIADAGKRAVTQIAEAASTALG